MASLTSSMDEIYQFTSATRDIVQAIDDIAMQTNLLALNAAVEAARAGEAGKGFAVVSEAVRTLAGQSATSANKISEMIAETVDRINEGTRLAGSTCKAFNQIVSRNSKASDLIQQIAQASNEQSGDITTVSKTLLQLDKTAQQNAAEAHDLAQTMSQFTSDYTKHHKRPQ
jgi:methyl-accepting chemotaxis protein